MVHTWARLVFVGPFTSSDAEGVVVLMRQQVPPRQSSIKGEERALLEPSEKQKFIPLAMAFGDTL